jgi:hypothetical protein
MTAIQHHFCPVESSSSLMAGRTQNTLSKLPAILRLAAVFRICSFLQKIFRSAVKLFRLCLYFSVEKKASRL